MKNTVKLTIDLDEILNNVLAESAWRGAYDESVRVLTRDQSALIERKIRAGFDDLCLRTAGYLVLSSFNSAAESDHIRLWYQLRHAPEAGMDELMHSIVVQMLGYYALWSFYGVHDGDLLRHNESVYHLAWRKWRTQLLLLLARDANRD